MTVSFHSSGCFVLFCFIITTKTSMNIFVHICWYTDAEGSLGYVLRVELPMFNLMRKFQIVFQMIELIHSSQ